MSRPGTQAGLLLLSMKWQVASGEWRVPGSEWRVKGGNKRWSFFINQQIRRQFADADYTLEVLASRLVSPCNPPLVTRHWSLLTGHWLLHIPIRAEPISGIREGFANRSLWQA
jgi:hypothetical protein